MAKKSKADRWADRAQAGVAKVEAKSAVRTARDEAKAARRAARLEAKAARKSAKADARAARKAARAAARADRPRAAWAMPELNISAKLRVTLWFTLMVLIFAALMLVFVFVVNGSAVTDNPAGRLIRVVMSNADDVEFDHGTIDWNDLDAYDGGVYCTYYDVDGDVLMGAMPEGLDAAMPFMGNVVRTVDNLGVDYYIYDTYVDMELSGLWVRGAISSQDRSGVMHTIVLITLTVLPALLLLTVGGGWLIARGAFRPMEKVIDAADDISDGSDLSARIALRRGPTEMRRLGRTFDAMFERLEASFNAEKQFASDASHELRTPITVILAECDHARRKAQTREDFLAAIGVIDEQGRHMSELVQSLLGLTRMERGTDAYPLRRGSLSDFIESCCNEFVPADDRGITLKMNIQPDIETVFNPALISRLVQNLLQNAYKYGRENGHILLTLKSGSSGAELSVKDDGIGIAREDQHKIWQRFWQADASHSEDGGSGLGLAMVKEIAQFHGGSARVDSTLGEGSTFTVTIPRQ